MLTRIDDILGTAKTAAILGHLRPDGDCVGSCLGLKNYLELSHPKLRVQVYLEDFPNSFRFLKGAEEISHDADDGTVYDLCIVLDAGDKERIGDFSNYFDSAAATACIDHHITNSGFAQMMHVCPDRSATSEVLFTLMDDAFVDKNVAECLYMGIVHDTGVFKHSNTTGETMRIAGELIDKGIDFSGIIDRTFYEKTYRQNQILGRALLESILFMDGKCVVSMVDRKTMNFYQVEPYDLDGIVSQLRNTKGVECAIFMYELKSLEYKVSLRSNGMVDVAKVASFFGGGGHVRAAGVTMQGTFHDIVNNLSSQIALQLK